MHAMDVMTSEVVTVGPDTSVQALAALLAEKGISGVPVVDAESRVIGIVSEGDLLHRAETGTERRVERRRRRWLDTIAVDEDARDYVKSHGRSVRDIMTREVISVSEATELADVAMLLETKRIKRVPVLRDGKPVGIISRANLVRALAATKSAPPETIGDDRTIRDKLLAELSGKDWAKLWPADIIVRERTVHLWLPDESSEEERQALRVAAENIPGVAGVVEHIVPVPLTPAF